MAVAKPFLPHPPSPKQAEFLALTCEEALYGGAGGGGKTDALLMDALQYVDVPGYAALLLRRKSVDLEQADAILERARRWWYGTVAKWDARINGFRFPTRQGQPDATISFGHILREEDKYRYKGPAFQYIGFDELTQFTETQYTYLFSRLRRPKGMPVPLRMRGSTNPGDVGHEWVKARFVTHSREISPDHFVSPPSAALVQVARELGIKNPQGAHWIKSLNRDNPGLDVNAYRMQLARLDPLERARMEFGDWDAQESGEFFLQDYFQIVPVYPPGLRWLRYWDLAATAPSEKNPDPDWTAGVKMAFEFNRTDEEPKVWISDVQRDRRDPGGTMDLVVATAKLDGRLCRVWIEEEPGSAGKNNTVAYQRKLIGYSVEGHRKTGDKASYWRPLSSQGKAKNIYLAEAPWNGDFVRELKRIPHGKKDQADAAAGAFDRLMDSKGADRLALLVAAAKL